MHERQDSASPAAASTCCLVVHVFLRSAFAATSLFTTPFPLSCCTECQNVRNRNLLNLSRSKLRLQELRIGHMSSAPYGKPRITNQVSWLLNLTAASRGAAHTCVFEAGGTSAHGQVSESTRGAAFLSRPWAALRKHQSLLLTSGATGWVVLPALCPRPAGESCANVCGLFVERAQDVWPNL